MLSEEESIQLLNDFESDQVERKQSLSSKEKVLQAICAFANDLPNHRTPGHILIGLTDDGRISGLSISDDLLLELASIRDSGKILPLPHLEVHTGETSSGKFAIVRVYPSDAPPVRLDGQVWIRVGPRRAIASADEERRLTEKSTHTHQSFDRRPCKGSLLEDILIDTFRTEYLPNVVDREVLIENHREIREQLASLRMFDLRANEPTNAGILILGRDPRDWFPGAYVQFARYDGLSLADNVLDQREVSGNLMTQLRLLDELIPIQIRTSRGASTTLRHVDQSDYPSVAIRELVMNAVMHRAYEATNAPIKINWFSDRVEIQNVGGLYGHVTAYNFASANDYRNPVIAEALKALGYVEKFGVGISRTFASLAKNGNPPPNFTFEATHVLAVVRSAL